VPPSFELPELPGAQVETHHLRVTCYDTEDALLQAHRVTMRRRLGGPDEGWHLKLPHPEGRLELHRDAGPTKPPGATRPSTAPARRPSGPATRPSSRSRRWAMPPSGS